MLLRSKLCSRAAGKFLLQATAAALLLCHVASCVAPAAGQTRYLVPGRPDGVSLLPPPPLAGSEEAAADLASVRAVFQGRTPAQEARAVKSAGLSMFLFAPAIGDFFQRGKLPKTEALFEKVKKDISGAVDDPKKEWQRRRPYEVDPALRLGQPESNASYPSGHSTRGTVYALMFAELFPDKREAILKIGAEIGWDRVVIGKHFPTDIFAGRVLGQAIFRELDASPEFQRDLAAARAEAEALRGAVAK